MSATTTFICVLTGLLLTTSAVSAQVFVGAMDAQDAVQHGATLLDARSTIEYMAGHPSQAAQIDWMTFSSTDQAGMVSADDERVAQLLNDLGVDADPVYIVGAWTGGWGEEGRIFWMLEYLGHSQVYIVEGGYAAWLRAGLPVQLGANTPATGEGFTITRNEAILATRDELPGATIYDTRETGEYDGATPYGSERGGHIPGAVSAPWTSVLDADGTLLSAEQIDAMFPASDADTVVYCTGGVRSGFVYAALRHYGRDDVANYAASWWDYASSDAPIEQSP